MKHLKRNSFLLLAITILVLILVLKDNFTSTLSVFSRMDFRFILLAFGLYFLYIFLQALVNYLRVHNKEKFKLHDAVQHAVITQFFNGITPFSSGGQPMEIYMLRQHGFRTTKATNIIMQNFIVYQLALVVFGIFAVCYNAATGILHNNALLKNLIVLGFAINTLVAVFLLFLATSKKFTHLVMKILIHISSKLKFVKNKEETVAKWEERLNDFHQYTKEITKRKKFFVAGIFLNLLALACYYAIPLVVTYSLHDFSSLTLIDSLVASAYILIIGAFVPIPGATGGIEYGFLQMFSNFLPTSELNAIMIVWRFITYYFGMILGGIMFNFHHKGGKE